ncbi:ArsR/SmtB family transcription factor [Actinokineospora iranica]|uniref:DNA-binding transcriptional regulator, ArsR family n=1 Tax=Actinokineospora iranica TaxID=1271860 RepID=A0A1G6XIW7_9PSEU|nr:metalloregulator ArsR/SmtB family transcription factor [Actinokineospora iranica]SDD77146.1 DNA-binding transcriptional regulator, ArsR family [Actinokineospora iranica]
MGELDEPEVERLVLPEVLHAFSDPTRLAVITQLSDAGEMSCGNLAVSVAKSTLSQHLRVLREAGVTHTRRDGNQRWLSVRRADLDRRFPGLLDSILGAVERVNS